MVTLVCYGSVILHSCVCTLPTRMDWESSPIAAAFPACIQPRVSNECVGTPGSLPRLQVPEARRKLGSGTNAGLEPLDILQRPSRRVKH